MTTKTKDAEVPRCGKQGESIGTRILDGNPEKVTVIANVEQAKADALADLNLKLTRILKTQDRHTAKEYAQQALDVGLSLIGKNKPISSHAELIRQIEKRLPKPTKNQIDIGNMLISDLTDKTMFTRVIGAFEDGIIFIVENPKKAEELIVQTIRVNSNQPLPATPSWDVTCPKERRSFSRIIDADTPTPEMKHRSGDMIVA